MTTTKIGPREQQLRLQREQQQAEWKGRRKTVMGLSVGTLESAARPKWKKQLSAVRANANRKDRRGKT